MDHLDGIRRIASALITSEEALEHLTCHEIEGVVSVLREADLGSMAESIVRLHGYGDTDCTDLHHREFLETSLRSGTEWCECASGFALAGREDEITTPEPGARVVREFSDLTGTIVAPGPFQFSRVGYAWVRWDTDDGTDTAHCYLADELQVIES